MSSPGVSNLKGSAGGAVSAGMLVGGQPDVRALSTRQNLEQTDGPQVAWGELPERIVRQFNPNALEFFAGLKQFSWVGTASSAYLPIMPIPKPIPNRLTRAPQPGAGLLQVPSVFVPIFG